MESNAMKTLNPQIKRNTTSLLMAVLFVAVLAVPNFAFASAFAGAEGKACGFMQNITSILNILSLAVVTAAIMFCGYQIIFQHKRISDCTSILIGALFIGAAGQIAKMMLGNSASAECTGEGDIFTMVVTYLPLYA
jgi:type IV secretion system protein VirB2